MASTVEPLHFVSRETRHPAIAGLGGTVRRVACDAMVKAVP